MPVLAGDIGGTKTLLQIAEFERGGYRVLSERRFENRAYTSFDAIVGDFIAQARVPVRAACFGIAGPITATAAGESVNLTNLPWTVDSATLAYTFDIPKVRLINDFQAAAYGMDALQPHDLIALQAGVAQPQGTRALIGAGTGLGQGLLLWHGDHYEAHPTEGGHVDFGPTDEFQMELLQHLMKQHGRVSYERVVSGKGLVNIFNFLRTRCGECATDVALDADDLAASITHAADRDRDPLAQRALDVFVKIYGAQAGNLALTVLATGGVYVAGGIAPKIVTHLTNGNFIRAFLAKGRMSPLLETIPVHVIVNPALGLMGTALAANRL